MNITSRTTSPIRAIALLVIGWLTGCGVGIEPLMPTPVLYTQCGFGPLEHVPDSDRVQPRRVYFATTRARSTNAREITYPNNAADDIGVRRIRFG